MISYERIDKSDNIDFTGYYRVYIVGVDKKAAIYLLNNSVLDDKGVI